MPPQAGDKPLKTASKTAPPKTAKDQPHYAGHRARMRERFLTHGADGFADYELLEMLLYGAVPRADTKPLAKALLKEFGGLPNLLAAEPQQLKARGKLGETSIATLKLAAAMAMRMARAEIINRPVLNSWQKVIDYCRLRMGRLAHEEIRVLFLDAKNSLIGEECHQRGTVDEAATYPREVVKRALDCGASAIILVHNHPSGDCTPSKADIETTRLVQKAASALGIGLHDHLIIGQGEYLSFKNLGLL